MDVDDCSMVQTLQVFCMKPFVAVEPECVRDYSDDFAVDDNAGGALDPNLVRAARAEGLSEFYRRGVWDEVTTSDCLLQTGQPPITARWVDTNNGEAKAPLYRCRFVAREIKALHGGEFYRRSVWGYAVIGGL